MTITELIEKHVRKFGGSVADRRNIEEFAIELLDMVYDECAITGISFEESINKALEELRK